MTTRIGSFNASSAARISRAVQTVERAGGGGIIRRGKFDDTGDADTLTTSFYPRLAKNESGDTKLYIRKGYVSLLGGIITEFAPESGDEHEIDYTLTLGNLAVSLQWTKPADPDDVQADEGWSFRTATSFTYLDGDPGRGLVIPLCLVETALSGGVLSSSIAWADPGDKLDLVEEPGDQRAGAHDVLVYDTAYRRYARVRDVPPPDPETAVYRLQQVAGSLVTDGGFRWVVDIPDGENTGDVLRWDGTSWVLLPASNGAILIGDSTNGWEALSAPSGDALLRCDTSGKPYWSPVWNYENP